MKQKDFEQYSVDIADSIKERLETHADNIIAVVLIVNIISLVCVWFMTQ